MNNDNIVKHLTQNMRKIIFLQINKNPSVDYTNHTKRIHSNLTNLKTKFKPLNRTKNRNNYFGFKMNLVDDNKNKKNKFKANSKKYKEDNTIVTYPKYTTITYPKRKYMRKSNENKIWNEIKNILNDETKRENLKY